MDPSKVGQYLLRLSMHSLLRDGFIENLLIVSCRGTVFCMHRLLFSSLVSML
jgi:hypothetical protein